MSKTITPLLVIGLFLGFFASCASSPEEEKKPEKPIKDPVVEVVPPSSPSHPADGWHILKSDTQFPTDDQLADGAESSLGKDPATNSNGNNPSTSIKPPPSEPEDQLAPSD